MSSLAKDHKFGEKTRASSTFCFQPENSEGAFRIIDVMGDNEEEGTRFLSGTH